jgi:hypothetical protein
MFAISLCQSILHLGLQMSQAELSFDVFELGSSNFNKAQDQLMFMMGLKDETLAQLI